MEIDREEMIERETDDSAQTEISGEAMLNDPESASSPVKITSQLLTWDNLACLSAANATEREGESALSPLTDWTCWKALKLRS